MSFFLSGVSCCGRRNPLISDVDGGSHIPPGANPGSHSAFLFPTLPGALDPDRFPSLDDGRGILTTYAGKMIVYVSPGHLAFDTQMPRGRIVLRVVQTRDMDHDPVQPMRGQTAVGQARSTGAAEAPFGDWRRLEVFWIGSVILGFAPRKFDCVPWKMSNGNHQPAGETLAHPAMAKIAAGRGRGDLETDFSAQAPAGGQRFRSTRCVEEGPAPPARGRIGQAHRIYTNRFGYIFKVSMA